MMQEVWYIQLVSNSHRYFKTIEEINHYTDRLLTCLQSDLYIT